MGFFFCIFWTDVLECIHQVTKSLTLKSVEEHLKSLIEFFVGLFAMTSIILKNRLKTDDTKDPE